jgi:hypothetical protein
VPVYSGLDRFGSVIGSAWERTSGSGMQAYGVALAYDENSNIARVIDQVHSLDQMSVLYAMDDL